MLLAVRDLKTYFFTAAGTVRAVDGMSYDVRAGETVALVGESGCGKSVSALSIMRLVAAPAGRIVGGEIRFRQQDLLTLDEEAMRRIRGRDIAMIFQEPMTSLNPVLSIGRQLTEPLEIHLSMPTEPARQRAVELLTLVGIPDHSPGRHHSSPDSGADERPLPASGYCHGPDYAQPWGGGTLCRSGQRDVCWEAG